jgi:hypothetical protein
MVTFASVPSLGERIVEHLSRYGASLDDAELADALGVRRPAIAEACKELEAQGLVVRNMAGGIRPVAPPVAAVTPPVAVAPAPAPGPVATPTTPTTPEAPPFPDHARRLLSARWGTILARRLAALPGNVTQPFELVSGNGRIVGDIVWLTRRGRSYEAKASAIAEAVLVVGHVTNADRRFLLFGEEYDAVSRWIGRYRPLLDGVELWYLDGDRLERLA